MIDIQGEQYDFGMGPTLNNLIILGLEETANIKSYYVVDKMQRTNYLQLAGIIRILRLLEVKR